MNEKLIILYPKDVSEFQLAIVRGMGTIKLFGFNYVYVAAEDVLIMEKFYNHYLICAKKKNPMQEFEKMVKTYLMS